MRNLFIIPCISTLAFLSPARAQGETIRDTILPDLLPESTSGMIIRHTYYTFSYSEEHEQAEWVYFELTPAFIKGEEVADGVLREDPAVPTGSAVPEDYIGTEYLPGMLCPPDMMKLNKTAMSETFLMSNTTPVKENYMLKHLEEVVKSWVLREG